jgi:hypothetical protein
LLSFRLKLLYFYIYMYVRPSHAFTPHPRRLSPSSVSRTLSSRPLNSILSTLVALLASYLLWTRSFPKPGVPRGCGGGRTSTNNDQVSAVWSSKRRREITYRHPANKGYPQKQQTVVLLPLVPREPANERAQRPVHRQSSYKLPTSQSFSQDAQQLETSHVGSKQCLFCEISFLGM